MPLPALFRAVPVSVIGIGGVLSGKVSQTVDILVLIIGVIQ